MHSLCKSFVTEADEQQSGMLFPFPASSTVLDEKNFFHLFQFAFRLFLRFVICLHHQAAAAVVAPASTNKQILYYPIKFQHTKKNRSPLPNP
jgi:hypothetical protein